MFYHMIEISSLRSTVEHLIEEVRDLKAKSSQSSQSSLPDSRAQPPRSSGKRRAISVSPEPPGGFSTERISLEKMSEEQYKTFRVL